MDTLVSIDTDIDSLARNFSRQRPVRVGAMLITVFGDVLMPRGGAIATQSLMEIMKLLGVESGGVRTALSRLTSDGMFYSNRAGRRSFYHLTETAWQEYDHAARIIYAPPRLNKWKGDWTVLLDVRANDSKNGDDSLLVKELTELGFSKVGNGVYIRPSMSDSAMRRKLDLLLDDQPVLVIDGHGGVLPTGFKSAADALWDLSQQSHDYARFVRKFQPLLTALKEGAVLDDERALVLRLLLIHEHRQLILSDPLLPIEILPADWSGDLARSICRDLYSRVFEASERWINTHCKTEDGSIPQSSGLVRNRFGGMTQARV